MNHFRITSSAIVQAVLLAALLVGWLPAFFGSKITSDKDISKVTQVLVKDLDPALYPEQTSQKMRRFIGLDPSLFEETAFYRSGNALNGSELLIVKSSSQKALEEFEQAAKDRIESQKNIYQGYAPDQAALMDKALVNVQGNYALYYVGENGSGIERDFIQALK